MIQKMEICTEKQIKTCIIFYRCTAVIILYRGTAVIILYRGTAVIIL